MLDFAPGERIEAALEIRKAYDALMAELPKEAK